MSNRKLMEDNENMSGQGNPKRYTAQGESGQQVEEPTTAIEWLQILGMMLLTYLVIITLWLICMYGIEHAFQTTVSIFMAVFVIYVIVVGTLWKVGLSQRDELVRRYIEDKVRENQVEIGAK